MRLLVCIDDTDNLESKGTGHIAAEMRRLVEEKGWGRTSFITRHQLLIHPDIPYTSHNSSMCFEAEIEEGHLELIKHALADYLEEASAEGSDPGICIADAGNIKNPEALVSFAYRAKREVLNKALAYAVAAKTGVFLQERGGSGDGVIGALAGVGLRLSGNDGEVKGGISHLLQGESYSVRELLREELISAVCTADMVPLKPEETVKIKWKAKPVLYRGRPVLLAAVAEGGGWLTLDKQEMRRFGDERANTDACEHFRADVPEELVDVQTDGGGEHKPSCLNCAYRRWTENSFVCARDGAD